MIQREIAFEPVKVTSAVTVSICSSSFFPHAHRPGQKVQLPPGFIVQRQNLQNELTSVFSTKHDILLISWPVVIECAYLKNGIVTGC
jgi:hypothetical protein